MAKNEKIKGEAKISSPIYSAYHRMKAFYGVDPDVTVDINEKKNYINVIVTNDVKSKAYLAVVPQTINDIEIRINGKKRTATYKVTTEGIRMALGNHPFVSDIDEITVEGITRLFVFFEPVLVQYFNDNFSHPEGLETKTPEQMACELLYLPGICKCTISC